jgi:hypothetical protein
MGTSATGDSISGLEVTTLADGNSPLSKSNSDPGGGEGGWLCPRKSRWQAAESSRWREWQRMRRKTWPG